MKARSEPQPLGSRAFVIAGQSPDGKYYNNSCRGLPFYQGKKDFGERELQPPTVWTSQTTKEARPRDILMSVRAPVGPINFAREAVCIGRGLAAIRCRDGLDPDFLFYQLLQMQADIAGKEGAVFASISKVAIEALNIVVPPLPEQHRIVAILNEAFEGIATAKANAEKNLKNARDLFTRHREIALAVQQGWREAALADLCTIKHGYAFEGEFFSAAGDYVLLTPGSFFETGGYRERGKKTKYFVGQIPSDYVLAGDDLLVAMTEQAAGLLGSPLLVPDSNRFLHNQRLGLVVGRPSMPWSNEFFFHVFNLIGVRREIHASASGAKVRHTSPKKIGLVRVAYPDSVDEQRRIAATLVDFSEECDRLENIYQRKLNALEELKKSLLRQAFSGQLTSSKQPKIAKQAALQTTTPEFSANIISLAYARHERQKREKTFGHVKEQKLLQLVESIAGIDLGRQPMRDAAGPNDFQHMLRAESWAKTNGFFDMVKRGEGYEFSKLSAFDEHMSRARQALAPYLSRFEPVIDLLVPMDTEEAEVFTTVHAAWSNLLIDGVQATDDAIVSAAREGWHTDKLKIPEHKFRSAIEKIRQKKLIPDGSAKYVGGQQTLL